MLSLAVLALDRGHLRGSCCAAARTTDAMTTADRYMHAVVAAVHLRFYSIEVRRAAAAAVVVAVAVVATLVSTTKTASVVAVVIAGVAVLPGFGG